MLSKEVDIDFGKDSRNRGGAFAIKRSQTKNLNCKSHRSLISKDPLSARGMKLEKVMKYKAPK